MPLCNQNKDKNSSQKKTAARFLGKYKKTKSDKTQRNRRKQQKPHVADDKDRQFRETRWHTCHLTTLYSFRSRSGCTDGFGPAAALVIEILAGQLAGVSSTQGPSVLIVQHRACFCRLGCAAAMLSVRSQDQRDLPRLNTGAIT